MRSTNYGIIRKKAVEMPTESRCSPDTIDAIDCSDACKVLNQMYPYGLAEVCKRLDLGMAAVEGHTEEQESFCKQYNQNAVVSTSTNTSVGAPAHPGIVEAQTSSCTLGELELQMKQKCDSCLVQSAICVRFSDENGGKVCQGAGNDVFGAWEGSQSSFKVGGIEVPKMWQAEGQGKALETCDADCTQKDTMDVSGWLSAEGSLKDSTRANPPPPNVEPPISRGISFSPASPSSPTIGTSSGGASCFTLDGSIVCTLSPVAQEDNDDEDTSQLHGGARSPAPHQKGHVIRASRGKEPFITGADGTLYIAADPRSLNRTITPGDGPRLVPATTMYVRGEDFLSLPYVPENGFWEAGLSNIEYPVLGEGGQRLGLRDSQRIFNRLGGEPEPGSTKSPTLNPGAA